MAAPASLTTPTAASTTETSPCPSRVPDDGRTVHLVGLGGAHTAALLARIAAEMNDAAQAVTAFWGPDWPRDIVMVAAGSDAEFGSLAGGGPDIAATTTAERMMFAPGAAAMSDASLRIVLRHELFHYASPPDTATDAPRWLTEGVADFVGRPPAPRPAGRRTVGANSHRRRTQHRRPRRVGGLRPRLVVQPVRRRRATAAQHCGPLYLRACGPGHPGAATAVRDILGADLPTVLARWRHWMSRLA